MDSSTQPKEPKKYLTTNEAAEYIRSTYFTLVQWRYISHKTGRLKGPPWIGDAARIVYAIQDLDEWMYSRRIALKSKPRVGRPRKPVIPENETAAA